MESIHKVLIAGIGGASLGTEILKCLMLAGRYAIFGCDVSRYAFGLYAHGFERTFLVDRSNYADSVIGACRNAGTQCVIPGGEEPMMLLSRSASRLKSAGIHLATNLPAVIEKFTDKKSTFEALGKMGFKTPLTVAVEQRSDLDQMAFPCIVKPAVGTGGSSFVFCAENYEEAWLYSAYLIKNGKPCIVQEYIPEKEGEFTVGVLSLPDGRLVGSIALRRIFDAKLSVLSRGKSGLISSGYSQGLVDDFPEVCAEAERIAVSIGSCGPLNIQGRVRNGTLIPFEINPRFSASAYLRALAGFNEVDLYLQFVLKGVEPSARAIRPGYYLRSLCEIYVAPNKVSQWSIGSQTV